MRRWDFSRPIFHNIVPASGAVRETVSALLFRKAMQEEHSVLKYGTLVQMGGTPPGRYEVPAEEAD